MRIDELIKNYLKSKNKTIEILASELQLSVNFFRSIFAAGSFERLGIDRLRILSSILQVPLITLLEKAEIIKSEELSEWKNYESKH